MAADFWGNDAHIGAVFSSDPWDLVIIGGAKLPGIAKVKGIAQLELDKKKTKGTNGVRLTVTGYQPGPFEVSVSIWTDEQWNVMQDWISEFWIEPRKARPEFTTTTKRTGVNPDGTPKFAKVTTKNRAPQVAVDISHPALEAIGIVSCVIQGISIPEDEGSNGDIKVVKIKLVESVEPTGKTITKSNKGSSNNVPLATRLQGKKSDTPPKPSTVRADLGPNGPRPAPAQGSD